MRTARLCCVRRRVCALATFTGVAHLQNGAVGRQHCRRLLTPADSLRPLRSGGCGAAGVRSACCHGLWPPGPGGGGADALRRLAPSLRARSPASRRGASPTPSAVRTSALPASARFDSAEQGVAVRHQFRPRAAVMTAHSLAAAELRPVREPLLQADAMEALLERGFWFRQWPAAFLFDRHLPCHHRAAARANYPLQLLT